MPPKEITRDELIKLNDAARNARQKAAEDKAKRDAALSRIQKVFRGNKVRKNAAAAAYVAALPGIRKSALELATGLELSEHDLSRSKADDARIATAAATTAAARITGDAATAETTLKRSALELATGLELAQHEISKSTKKLTALESNKLEQTALELATGIELADYKLKHPESLLTQLGNYYKKDSRINLVGAFLILINLILFILLVTFVGQKKGYDNGIEYNTKGNTKQKADIAFTICFVFILAFSGIFYFNYIK